MKAEMLVKHSISIKGHQTSYSLEPEFFSELKDIAEREGVPLARLVTSIDVKRDEKTNLSSALRLFVLRKLKARSEPH